jgi:glycerol-3-phosphate acyltransferase PlsY
MSYLISLILGFLVGSIPWGYLLARVFKKIDIREHGSRNIGATNVWRICGKALGIPAFILDAGKGFIVVFLITNWFGINPAILAGSAAIAGHTFTPWLRFRGGKGVATGLGVFVGLVPFEAFAAFAAWGLILLISGWISVASMGAAGLFVALVFVRNPLSPLFFFALLAFLLVMFRHHSNIRRLIQGKEPKIGNRK